MLPALWGRSLAHGRDRHGSPVRSACAGAALSDAQKARIREINGELSKLGTQFDQNVLAEVNDSAVVVDSRDQLKGMSEEQIAATAEAAKARKLDGKYVIALLNTTGQPAETQLQDRALRQQHGTGHEEDGLKDFLGHVVASIR